MPRHERPLEVGLSRAEPTPDIADGELQILGQLPRASNFTFLARVTAADSEGPLVVYKPRRGEQPLWDFPEGTLCQREVAAFVLAESLGWPNVPMTILRDGPYGPGSVQLFIDADPTQHYFTLARNYDDQLRLVALFDMVANNADRKSGHCLLGDDGRIWVVDHGVCFAEDPKLRTVIWDFAGEELPRGACEALRRLAAELEEEPLSSALGELLSPAEMVALRRRAETIAEAPRFPEPTGERPYPWPPI